MMSKKKYLLGIYMALINLEITNLSMVIKLNPSRKKFYESLGVNMSNFPLTWDRNEPFCSVLAY